MQPVIGVTSDFHPRGKGEATYFLRARYVEAIRDLGGTPVILPPTVKATFQSELLDRIDGFLITGSGPDLDPRLYGQKKKGQFPVMSPQRAHFEIALARKAVKENRPLLGICGGLQVLNVALGGSLIQDITSQFPDALPHRQETSTQNTRHWVEIVPHTKLFDILGNKKIRVNSSHHQATQKIASGLIINATAYDGIIEGLEYSKSPFVIGVQWHPEFLYRKDAPSQRLFRAFLDAARS